ncbi:23S rRNA (guanosine(2251)-2'-O)-methyltransferase RlmB [Prochlorococcus sp. MIT 0801]|uniref:23S rRNA (guanosine(2251)-2'-O)-methyltransferase RlmB n=1 Tax=Prochlorococcus sp. MIT 0801 TaxID=1501269 RepID=UPI00056E37B5|nr:23S rRNA (guanosine(2251)-2'-O)-methyltransferase RlmB [Prochlorococcus sp. MIT 0801]
MSYRFNKDRRNSKNSSSNKRSSNFSRQDNDSQNSNYNDRRRNHNKTNRLSSDPLNQYSLDKESSERSRSRNETNSNYRGSNRFERKSTNPSNRNQNSQDTNIYRGSNRFERKSANRSYRNQDSQETNNYRAYNRFERKSTNPSDRNQNFQDNNNYRGSNRFERKSTNASYKNKNSQEASSYRSEESIEPLSYSQSYTKTLSDDLIWGRHSTESALMGGRPIHRIWCTSELRSTPKFFQLLKDQKASGVLVEEVSWSRIGQLTNGAVHQGIVLQIAASKTHDLKNLIDACKAFGDSSLLLALDGLTDPQNLGAIIRSAEALGAQGLILPQRRSAGLTGSVAKVAAGALEHLPVARVVNLNRSLEKLKDEGYTVVGLAEEGTSTLSEIKFEGPLVVVVGSEDKGISLITRRLCDQLVRIPLKGVTTSLNASVATSIFLYEVARSRWMRSISGQDPSPRLLKPQISTENNN